MSVAASRANVPVPSKRERISPELEAELNAALGDLSLDQIVDDGSVSRASQAVDTDARLRATVVRIDKENVFFSLGGKNEGLVALQNFKEPPDVGARTGGCRSKGINPDDGLYELIVPGASIDVSGWDDLSNGAVVEARVTGANTGGWNAWSTIFVGSFRPVRSVCIGPKISPNFVNQKLLCVVMEVNPQIARTWCSAIERCWNANRKKPAASSSRNCNLDRFTTVWSAA